MWDYITEADCHNCDKHFTNKPHRVNIVLDPKDNKCYCKDCAIGKVLSIANKPNKADP